MNKPFLLAITLCLALAAFFYWISFDLLVNTELFVLACMTFSLALPFSLAKSGYELRYWKALAVTEILISVAHFLSSIGWSMRTHAIEHSDFASIRFAFDYWILAVVVTFAIYPLGYLVANAEVAG